MRWAALAVVVVALLGACLDFDGAAQAYCVNHPELCAEDGGTADGG